MKHYDVVLIGSGISALTSAALLGKKGKKVLVLEQYIKPGGYMHSFKRFNEHFETGAHYMGALGPGQPFRVMLEYLGVWEEGLFAPLDPTGFDVLHYPGFKVELPTGYEETIASLSSQFPGHKTAIRQYFELVRKVVAYFPTYNFHDRPWPDGKPDFGYPPEALEFSLRDIVARFTDFEPLKAVLFAYCGLHGVRPEEVAFGFHAIVTDSLIRGPYSIRGGGDVLTNKFVSVIKAQGGEVLCRHKVSQLELKDRHVSKILTENGAEFSAEWVISSIHPKATFSLLPNQDMFPPVFKERMKNIQESSGIFGLYAVFKDRPATRPDRNYYYFRSDNPEEMFTATNPGDVPPVVFVSSPKREWGPEETNFPQSFHIAAPFEWVTPFLNEKYGRRSPEYKNLKEKIQNSILASVERYQPGTVENLKAATSSTQMTHLHFNGSQEGSAYGIYHSMANTGAKAIGPRTKVLNLLLTGQSCVFPGLLGAATSALRTCGHVVHLKPILEDLQSMGEGI
jgi:all-trans-retinol 13,14-reductase